MALLALGLATLGVFLWRWSSYPSDRTPQGAYLRIVSAVNRDRPKEFFAYIETRAQHACFTIRDYRRKARERILAAYPEPERTRQAERLADVARAADGADVFALRARELGWLDRLRKDLSGIAKVQIQGERATVETARGTRYSFRRRDNGIWGLTMFTAALVAEAEKAARDFSIIDQAARDYDRARSVAAP
jgi:hypothetical protein